MFLACSSGLQSKRKICFLFHSCLKFPVLFCGYKIQIRVVFCFVQTSTSFEKLVYPKQCIFFFTSAQSNHGNYTLDRNVKIYVHLPEIDSALSSSRKIHCVVMPWWSTAEIPITCHYNLHSTDTLYKTTKTLPALLMSLYVKFAR